MQIGERAYGGIIFNIDETGLIVTVAALNDLGQDVRYLDVNTLIFNLNKGVPSDWSLPTKKELNLIYTNLHQKKLGNFENKRYLGARYFLDYFPIQYFQDGRTTIKMVLDLWGFNGGVFNIRAVRKVKIGYHITH